MVSAWKKLTQIDIKAYANARKKDPRKSLSRGISCCHTQKVSHVNARGRKGALPVRRASPRRQGTRQRGLAWRKWAGAEAMLTY